MNSTINMKNKLIPLNDFKLSYKLEKKSIDNAISRVLKSGWFILGEELKSFESELAKYLKVKYCVGVANGTEAITLALISLGIKKGDEVITTNMTAYPTIIGIEQTGAKAVLADIDPITGLIDPASIEKHITKKTRAIVPVHMYGQACDMDKILKIAKKYKVEIMEDCAQSIGSKYSNKITGTFCKVASLSFYPTKNLGALGDAGAIMTNDELIYQKLNKLRNYGQSVRYYHVEQGINSRLDEIQAAILREKLKRLNGYIKKRRMIANIYDKTIKNAGFVPEIKGRFHTYHLYIIKHKKRDELQKFLKDNGVQTLIHYPVPINEQEAFKFQKKEKFPNTVKFTGEILSIPIYPELKVTEAKKIASLINRFDLNK